MTITAAELGRLIANATNEELSDGGRYFAETCDDLTKCGHGCTGEYQVHADGPLVQALWNNRFALKNALHRVELHAAAEHREPPLAPPPPIDPRTGRPGGDHGTAQQAIEYALSNHIPVASQEREFLTAWQQGALDEWPEFYVWLRHKEAGGS